MAGLIYLILHKASGKAYVGQTWQTLEQRWKRHRSGARETHRKSMPILHAIASYGPDAFIITALEVWPSCTQEELDAREVHWVLTLRTFSPNGYNLRAGQARGKCSDELKAKIGAAHRGRKASEKARQRLSESHLGAKLSKAHVEKLSAMMKGKPLPPLAKVNAAKASIKSYTFCAPDGQLVMITNLRDFCKRKKLHYQDMSLVATGKRPQHRGWTLIQNHGRVVKSVPLPSEVKSRWQRRKYLQQMKEGTL